MFKSCKRTLYNGKNQFGLLCRECFLHLPLLLDDLSFAATWLYVVEKDPTYLKEIDSYLSNKTLWGESPFNNKWTMCWDDMYMAVFCNLQR